MTRVALSLHLLAVVLTVGPVTAAASAFPRLVRSAGILAPGSSGTGRMPQLPLLAHRTCRVYGVLGLAVPAFGVITAARLGVLTEAWVLVSMTLTLAAALLLALVVIPAQRAVLRSADGARAESLTDARSEPRLDLSSEPRSAQGSAGPHPALARLAGATGVFNLLWVAVLVLMVFRPGSTLGA